VSDTLARLLAEATLRNERREQDKRLARMLARAMVDPNGFLESEEPSAQPLKPNVFPPTRVRA
jgi:hypothetical protein